MASYPRSSILLLYQIWLHIANIRGMYEVPCNAKPGLWEGRIFFTLTRALRWISANHCPGRMRKTMETLREKHETWVAISSLSNFIYKSWALGTCVSTFRLGDQSSVPSEAIQFNRETQDGTAFHRSYCIKSTTNLASVTTSQKKEKLNDRDFRRCLPHMGLIKRRRWMVSTHKSYSEDYLRIF
jgi:hypothetical protein